MMGLDEMDRIYYSLLRCDGNINCFLLRKRLELGLSVYTVAQYTNLHRSTITRIESGKMVPKWDTARILIRFYHDAEDGFLRPLK